jgi:hypothetical protein
MANIDPSLYAHTEVVNFVPSRIALISPINAPESNSSYFF